MRGLPFALLLALVLPTLGRAEPPEGQLPPDAVAVVDDAVIARSTFHLWMATALRGRDEPLDSPEFGRCIEARRRSYRHLHGDRVRLRRSCARDHRQALSEVMQFLIQAEWVQGEAVYRGVSISDTRVRRSLARQKREAFPTERDYRRFLRSSGMTEEMVLFRVRLDMLQQRLIARAGRDIEPTRDPRVRARRQQRAISRYIAEFTRRWRARTACALGYVVAECGPN